MGEVKNNRTSNTTGATLQERVLDASVRPDVANRDSCGRRKRATKTIIKSSVDILNNNSATTVEKVEKQLQELQSTDVSPDMYLIQLVEAQCGYRPVSKQSLSLKNFFEERNDDKLAAYDKVIVAARDNDISKLRSLFGNGQSLDGCNRYGESLLHMACRRGFGEMTSFLLEEENGPKLSVRICDDCGRTPFHDACWNTQPQLEICSLILKHEPTLLLLTDKRGATPFQYARQQHWGQWRQFLYDHREFFNVMKEECLIERFSK